MLLLQFAVLQGLDALSTICFLRAGVAEANPLVRAVLGLGLPPLAALAGLKLIGLAPAWWAWRSGRHGLLRYVNVLFGLCVVWNGIALWLGRPGP